MLLDTNTVAKNGTARNGVVPMPREQTWLRVRLAKGEGERFVEIVKITPALAEVMLERNTRNRAMAPTSIARYAEAMQRGEWQLTPQGISFSRAGVLIDGQHRLASVVKAGCTIEATVWFGCDPGEFSAIDTGKFRTAAHLLSIDDLSYYTRRAALAQMFLRFDVRAVKIFDPAVVRNKALDMAGPAMDETLTVGDRANKVCSGTAASIAYYCILTKSAHVYKLPEFWEKLVTGANLQPRSPVLRLREYFRDSGLMSRNSRDRNVKEAAAIILAWNAHVKGQLVRSFEWARVIELPQVL